MGDECCGCLYTWPIVYCILLFFWNCRQRLMAILVSGLSQAWTRTKKVYELVNLRGTQ